MPSFLCTVIGQLLLLAYIASGVLIELGHREAHNLLFGGVSTIAQHECDTTEIHPPLDKRHYCLACTQSTQRISAEATQHVGVHALCVCFASIPLFREQPLETDVLHSGKRGPPHA
jgi:hypothetical protein